MNKRAEEKLAADIQSLFNQFLEVNPVMATYVGDHRFDDRLSDYSPESLDTWGDALSGWIQTFQSYKPGDLCVNSRIDCVIMIHLCRKWLRPLKETRLYLRDPDYAVHECLSGLYYLIFRGSVPLRQRLASMAKRLEQIGRVLEQSRNLIVIPLVPEIWAQMAFESIQQGLFLISSVIPVLAQQDGTMIDTVNAASATAAEAFAAHGQWIRETVVPNAKGTFAVGSQLFNQMLANDHLVDYTAEELISTGWKLFEQTEMELQHVAATIDPHKSVKELLEESKNNHPTAAKLLDTYRSEMARARQFVIEKKIATIPEGESIKIEPTPTFMRHVIPFAAYFMPAFMDPVQEGVFIVTPVDESAPPETVESKLRSHSHADIPVTALHEAYPGHHLQLVMANRASSIPRKIGSFLSSLFIEGWAFYCEEMMERLGFIDSPIQKLARLGAQLWRASRIIIDASLHTELMSVEEAIAFLVDRAGLSQADAAAEVRRYTQNPTQPQCYLMGKIQIVAIIDEYKRRFPDSSLEQMHDSILQCGSLPPRLMRMQLFDQDSQD
ncbi:MAG: DUF885 domain-containing protein [Chitinivibrionales bacterium]|nr:DUF885 domain-containing protein [Chitinivibrionales bacterium]